MTTGRNNQVLAVIAAVVVASFILVASHNSLAEEKKKISWSAKAENTKISAQQALEIPDIAGHIIRINEIRRTWPDGGAPTMEGQRVVEEIDAQLSDLIAGNGRGFGYTQWRFESGDQTFGEFQLTIQTIVNPDRSRKTTFVGTFVWTAGTGKLKGVKGLGRIAGVAELDAEGKAIRSGYSGDAEYWLER